MKSLKIRVFTLSIVLFLALLAMASCEKKVANNCNCPVILETAGNVEPLYKFSITSNDIDFIKTTDVDAFEALSYLRQDRKEMPDKRNDILFDENAFVFNATFEGGKVVEIWCHSSFGSRAVAEEYAEKVCPRLGKLPSVQRDMIDHVVIHKGDETAFAEDGFFILYSENMDVRISNNDLEETVFHESVHASLQSIHEKTSEWKLAQVADENYITEYAKKEPSLEDMPETALFVYTYIKYPGRLPATIEDWIEDYIPNRLEFFKKIYK